MLCGGAPDACEVARAGAERLDFLSFGRLALHQQRDGSNLACGRHLLGVRVRHLCNASIMREQMTETPGVAMLEPESVMPKHDRSLVREGICAFGVAWAVRTKVSNFSTQPQMSVRGVLKSYRCEPELCGRAGKRALRSTSAGRRILFSPTPKRQKPTHCAHQRRRRGGKGARARHTGAGANAGRNTPNGTTAHVPLFCPLVSTSSYEIIFCSGFLFTV